MGRPKRLYPLGRYRLRVPKDAEADKAYPVVLEYTWNRQIIRKTTNVFAKIADWNQNGNQGRGELRVSYGSEYKRLNQLLLSRVERIDSLLAEDCPIPVCSNSALSSTSGKSPLLNSQKVFCSYLEYSG
jgi:hypothetical protein